MKQSVLIGSGVVGLALIVAIATGASSANAQGAALQNGGGYGYEQSLTNKATALDMDKEQLRTQLQDKTMLQIIQEQNITNEQFHQKMQEAAKIRWEAAGMSEEQVQERLNNAQERQANCDGEGQPAGYGRHGRQDS